MQDFISVSSFLLNSGWAFLTSFNLPGVNFTPLAAIFFSSFFIIFLRFLRSVALRLNPSSPSISKKSK